MTETVQSDTDLELVTVSPPFLKITGTYPVGDDRFESVCLEMNLGPDEPLVAGGDGDDAGTRSWFIDFCTFTIDALRRAPRPQGTVIALTGSPEAYKLLAEKIQHVEGCDGSCGLPHATAGDGGRPAGDAPADGDENGAV